jgi:hypothetical protein
VNHPAALAFILVALAASPVARAGIGPENVLVVANGADPVSVRIAREYVRLRRVPACNLVTLSDVPSGDTVSLADFRGRVLNPILAEVAGRRLQRQISCVAYSSGFPYAVDVAPAMAGRSFPRYITQPASLTGLTYLHEMLDDPDPVYLTMDANRYHRGVRRPRRSQPASRADAVLRGRLDAALAHIQPQLQASPRPAAVEAELRSALDMARTLADRHADDPTLTYDLACLHALAGHPDEAVAALRLAVRGGWTNAAHTERDPDLTSLRDRADFRAIVTAMRAVPLRIEDPQPIRPDSRWADDGSPTRDASGRRYLPACMLAYVGPAANTEDEALACLRRSAGADFRRPRGTIYFMVSDDAARTGPRQWAFEPARRALDSSEVRAEVLPGVLPPAKDDVAGAVVGAASVAWSASRSRIVPGAFCEHLTSFAGAMRGAGQTLLSEWIRHGAAGSSGTVTEPYNVAAKFPSAFLQVFYAKGCSMAEAFYQSVAGPYQQLLVGDPLCAPWARPVAVAVSGIKAGALVTRPTRLLARVTGASPVRGTELYVDGCLAARAAPGKALVFDPARLRAGAHEVRIVGIAGPLEWRGRTIVTVRTASPGRRSQ